ncbi:MAG: hypothetical protein NC394_05600 [Bacteroides sp.]|nr:hypothetical protein [Bacteroides sp.]
MARSAKTKHVLDLVGTEPAKKMVSPSLQELKGKPPLLTPPPPPVPTLAEEMSELTGLPPEEFIRPSEKTVQEEKQPLPQQGMTFIVGELINRELETIVNRFNLAPTDSNLWELTRSAIETIRPEFSRNGEEYLEKCEKLRPRVIKEMTKAAVRIAAKDKKSKT